MPELPEVETVKRIIEPQIKGRNILRGIVHQPQVIAHPDAEEFSDALKGQKIEKMSRKGKFLSIHLASGDRIILHLRMTGSLLVTPGKDPLEKHTHVVLNLDDDKDLRFVDLRRFGRMWLIREGEEDDYSGISKLGLEPFEEGFDGTYLHKMFSGKRRAVKDCLLDQHMIAGIGNIYGDEILFAAQIHPQRSASSLSIGECQKLAQWIPQTLLKAIEQNQLSPEEYLAKKGLEYRSTPFFQVYGKKGQPCPVCGEILCRVTIAGRSSVYCPKCQDTV